MPNILQMLRSTVARRRPTGRAAGELWINFPDRAIGYIDMTGAAIDPIAIPHYSPSTTYAVGDLVRQGSDIQECITAVVAPEAFDPAKWRAITHTRQALDARYVTVAGDTMTGALTVHVPAAKSAVNVQADAGQNADVQLRQDGKDAWALRAEATSGQLRLIRFDAAGAYADMPMTVDRGTGNVTMTGTLEVPAGTQAAPSLKIGATHGLFEYKADAIGLNANLVFDAAGRQSVLTFTGDQIWAILNPGSDSPAGVPDGSLRIQNGLSGRPIVFFPGPAGATNTWIGAMAAEPTASDAALNVQTSGAAAQAMTPLRIEAEPSSTANMTMWTRNGGWVSRVDVAGAYIPNSDKRLKDNIADLAHGLDTVNALRPVSYTWKRSGRPAMGVIAQEAQAVLPDIVSAGPPDPDGTAYLGVDYTALIPVLLKAVQQLSAKVAALEARMP